MQATHVQGQGDEQRNNYTRLAQASISSLASSTPPPSKQAKVAGIATPPTRRGLTFPTHTIETLEASRAADGGRRSRFASATGTLPQSSSAHSRGTKRARYGNAHAVRQFNPSMADAKETPVEGPSSCHRHEPLGRVHPSVLRRCNPMRPPTHSRRRHATLHEHQYLDSTRNMNMCNFVLVPDNLGPMSFRICFVVNRRQSAVLCSAHSISYVATPSDFNRSQRACAGSSPTQESGKHSSARVMFRGLWAKCHT